MIPRFPECVARRVAFFQNGGRTETDRKSQEPERVRRAGKNKEKELIGAKDKDKGKFLH